MLLLTGPSFNRGKPFQLLDREIIIEPMEIDSIHTIETCTTVWDCSIILSKIMSIKICKDKRILELGSGRGLVSMACSLNGGIVTASEHGGAIKVLESTLLFNGFHDINVLELDWTDNTATSKFDVIVAADVVWMMDLIEPLVETMKRHSNKDTIIYLAHQSRTKRADDLLFSKLDEYGFQWTIETISDEMYRKENILVYKIFSRL